MNWHGNPYRSFSGGTKMNMVLDLADFTLDLRTVPGLAHDELHRRVCDRLGPALGVNRLLDLPPVLTDENDPWVRQVLNLLEQKGAPSRPGYVNYFTDALVLPPGAGHPPPRSFWGPARPPRRIRPMNGAGWTRSFRPPTST